MGKKEKFFSEVKSRGPLLARVALIKSCQFSPEGVFITTVLIILCFSCFLFLYCYVKFHYRFKFPVRMSRVDHELARNFTIFVITFFSSRTQILRKSLVRPHDRFHIPTNALLNGTEMTTRLVSLDSWRRLYVEIVSITAYLCTTHRRDWYENVTSLQGR